MFSSRLTCMRHCSMWLACPGLWNLITALSSSPCNCRMGKVLLHNTMIPTAVMRPVSVCRKLSFALGGSGLISQHRPNMLLCWVQIRKGLHASVRRCKV